MADADVDLSTSTLLPMARIRKIMRSDPEVKLASQEAVLLITKATVCLLATVEVFFFPVVFSSELPVSTPRWVRLPLQELFIEHLAHLSMEQLSKTKRKTVQQNDIGWLVG
jgi:histone H3/H4